jgi:glucokinase
MILGGDIGGTKTNLAFFAQRGSRLQPVVQASYKSANFTSLEDVVLQFLSEQPQPFTAACFGVAGPVRDGRCETTNLPWIIEVQALAARLEQPRTYLINDLEATAYAVEVLEPDELVTLQEGEPTAGNAAVIAAGTGLGEASLFWDGQQHHPVAGEGGHADFAARDASQLDLLEDIRSKHGHASWERVLSGPGIVTLYDFYRRRSPDQADPEVARIRDEGRDPAAVISQGGLSNKCGLCAQALNTFCSLYGAEAGNLALKIMAVGGIYVGGGIAPKIIEKLKDGAFVQAFNAKGRMRSLMEKIPVKVILSDRAALLGAARCAQLRSGDALM